MDRGPVLDGSTLFSHSFDVASATCLCFVHMCLLQCFLQLSDTLLYASVMMSQITTNIIRPLPPNTNIYFDPDEDEPALELSWPHLSVGGIMSSNNEKEKDFL